MMSLAEYVIGIMGAIIIALLVCCWKLRRLWSNRNRRINLVWSEGLNSREVDNLREQVELADSDFSIVANYPIHWESVVVSGNSDAISRVTSTSSTASAAPTMTPSNIFTDAAGEILRDSTSQQETLNEEEKKLEPARSRYDILKARLESRYDILKKAKNDVSV